MALYQEFAAGIGTQINPNLFPVNVSEKLQFEFLQISPLMDFAGNASNSIIVKQPMKKGAGVQWRIPRLRALDYKNPVMDLQQREGREQHQIVDVFTIDSHVRSFAVRVPFDQILSYAVPFNILNPVARELVDTNARNLNWEILKDFTVNQYPNIKTANCNVVGTLPSYDRAVPALSTTRAAWQANATFLTYLNGFQTPGNTTPAGTGLSVAHLRKLIRYATQGGSSLNIESQVAPANIETKNGWPVNKYVYLMTQESYSSLCLDPQFTGAGAMRGTVIDPNTPQFITGGFYKGEFEGVYLYVVPELSEQILTSADGNKSISWNLFLGAGAHTIGWADITNFGKKDDDYNMFKIFYSHDFRGQGMQTFASKYVLAGGAAAGSNPLVEQGVIHSFVSNPI